MTTETIIAGFIESQHGWVVRDQFIDTWNGEDFEKQNINALKWIKHTVNNLLNSNVFNEYVENKLVCYLSGLEKYLAHVE